jgi:hypothetical protein
MFLGASQVKPFYFILFGRKQLHITPKVSGDALPNVPLYISRVVLCMQRQENVVERLQEFAKLGCHP